MHFSKTWSQGDYLCTRQITHSPITTFNHMKRFCNTVFKHVVSFYCYITWCSYDGRSYYICMSYPLFVQTLKLYCFVTKTIWFITRSILSISVCLPLWKRRNNWCSLNIKNIILQICILGSGTNCISFLRCIGRFN